MGAESDQIGRHGALGVGMLVYAKHIVSMLAIPGRAAIVLPDNVLFAGGAAEKIRRRLLTQCDVHTLLRLPTGLFYTGGVKANILFFDKNPPSAVAAQTSIMWVYDLRTGQRFTHAGNWLTEHLGDFIRCYRPGGPRDRRIETTRFKPFSYDELIARDKANFDIVWPDNVDKSTDDLPLTATISAILEDYTAILDNISTIRKALEQSNGWPSPT